MSYENLMLYDESIKFEIDKRINDNKVVIDSTLSSESTNPVQNKVLDAEFETINSKINEIKNSQSGNADWNQNDENGAGYIANRTHYIDRTEVELLSEFDVGGDTYIDLYDVALFSKLTPNAKCLVTIDSIVYETTAIHNTYNAYEWYIIGNSDLLGEAGEFDTHLPFGIFVDRYDENWGECSEEIYTIKIDCIGETVVKIPEIYLPAKIGIEGTGAYSEIFNNLTENKASGDYSRAENFETTASGYASSAQGLGTTSSGYASHSQGCYSTAQGAYTHAEGYYTLASGAQSHAEGSGTIAKGENQHVSGSYNVEDTTSLVIVGNGTSSNSKSNAYKLDKSGNGYFAGDIVAYGCSSANSPISLVSINTIVQSLDEMIGDGIEDITSEEIQALFA